MVLQRERSQGRGLASTPGALAKPTAAFVATLSALLPPQAFGQQRPPPECHQSYWGWCVPPDASDVDCLGGTGDGPVYVGRVLVVGTDVYRLDSDGDGIGCESSPTGPLW